MQRQRRVLHRAGRIEQVTMGWDESAGHTVVQRSKEYAHDYRYFPEPDLPPLVIDSEWIESIQNTLPEMPVSKFHRFRQQYGLNDYDAGVLVAEQTVADYYEAAVTALGDDPQSDASPQTIAHWITGELFGLLNQYDVTIEDTRVTPEALISLVQMVSRGEINQNTAKAVLTEMFATGIAADKIIAERGLHQISDSSLIAELVSQVLAANPEQVEAYVHGKDSISRWLFGQVMRTAKGQANPQILQNELDRQLSILRQTDSQ